MRGSPGSGHWDLGQGQVSLLGPFLFQSVPRLPGPYFSGDGRAHAAHRVGADSGPRPGPGHTRLTRFPAVGAPEQNFQNCPRERFPKPNLVWPSGAAVQSTLLKGERWLRLRDVGSPRGPGDKEEEPRCAGRTEGAASREGFTGLSEKASGIASTFSRPRSGPRVSAGPRASRGGRVPCPRAFL